MDHVFVNSVVAMAMWADLEQKMKVYSRDTSLQLKLNRWWLSQSKSPCHKALLSLIPTCVCWELWISRNKARFDNKTQHVDHIISSVVANIRSIVGRSRIFLKRRYGDN